MQLNPQQQAVVNATTGPCLVIAGAGSGKTRVIINKILNLINSGIPDRNIYAVTFTNKAAKEMNERLRHELREKCAVHISTFHTLGLEIIRNEHRHLNLKQKVILTDTHDQRVLLRDLLLHSQLESNIDEEIDIAQAFISKAKNDLYLPGDLPRNAKEFSDNPIFIKMYNHLTKIYHYYFAYMQSISALDFDDLIFLPTLLLTHNPEMRNKYNKRVQYLLVDEYQDTNTSQYELVKLLVGQHQNFTVVGDDDQSIYSWRGAQPENLNRLKEDFPKLRVFFLEQNYRSTENILHAANVLIANNPHIYNKTLRSVHGKGKRIEVLAHSNSDEEAQDVVKQILQHKIEHKNNFGDYAVLYRGNHQSRLLEKYFEEEEIPVAINGDSSTFEKPEIKDYLAYLRLLNNVEDDKALMRVINIPRRGISSKTIVAIGELAKKLNCCFFDACQHPELRNYTRGKAYEDLNEFLDLILRTQEAINNGDPDHPNFEALDDFFHELGYAEFLFEQTDNKKLVEEQLNQINRFMKMIKSWMTGEYDDPMSLGEVCQRLFLREMYANKAKENASEFVQLMTLHASKGLEFPYVHIIGCEEESIPHKNSIETDNIEEERRLMYVGITRAQQELTLHYATTRRKDGVEFPVEISRFIEELPKDVIHHVELSDEATQAKKQERVIKQADRLIGMLDDLID